MQNLLIIVFLEMARLSTCRVLSSTANYPSNWKDYISPEMIEKYNKSGPAAYSIKLFQGDIVGIDRQNAQGLKLNNAINDESKRWPNGVIPYEFSEQYDLVDRTEKILIQAAMNQISASTGGCVRFVPRQTQQDYIKITRGLSCSSQVGRTGGMQFVSLAVGCMDEIGSIQHEFMHALGFYHEHTRADRDDYVWINWANLPNPLADDFKVPSDATTFGLPYDYDSVLHYSFNAFAINKTAPTIIPKQKKQNIGQAAGLSLLDIYKLRRAYGCPETNIPGQGITSSHVTPARTTPSSTPRPDSKNKNVGGDTVPIAISSSLPDEKKPVLSALSDFRRVSVEEHVCDSLKTTNCHSGDAVACSAGRFAFQCEVPASSDEIKTFLQSVKKVIPSSPIWFEVKGARRLSQEILAPMADNILILGILEFPNFNFNQFSSIRLQNLLELRVFHCRRIRITKKGLEGFTQLKSLILIETTVERIEKEAIESLPKLEMLVFEWWFEDGLDEDKQAHLRRFHCSAEYAWFREFLDERSDLLNPRLPGSLFNVSGAENVNWIQEQFYVPVDCKRADLKQQVTPFQFAVGN